MVLTWLQRQSFLFAAGVFSQTPWQATNITESREERSAAASADLEWDQENGNTRMRIYAELPWKRTNFRPGSDAVVVLTFSLVVYTLAQI